MIPSLDHRDKESILNAKKNEKFIYHKMIVSVFLVLFFTSQCLFPIIVSAQTQNTHTKQESTYTYTAIDNANDSWILSPHPNNE